MAQGAYRRVLHKGRRDVVNEYINLIKKPDLKNPTLLVTWVMDSRSLGASITDFLIKNLENYVFCEIEPVEFFTLSGVNIEDDFVQFPESRFYACPDEDLVLFKSTPPHHEWHTFLNLVLDVAQKYCNIGEVYTMGGMVSLAAHTSPRQFFSTSNSRSMKKALSQYLIARDTNYETPPGGKPTLNSYMLWCAKQRSIPGANLWVPVPFYLLSSGDPVAQKKIIEFLNRKFSLNMDLSDIDNTIYRTNERINLLREEKPEINEYISKIESNARLTTEENEKLLKEVEQFLKDIR